MPDRTEHEINLRENVSTTLAQIAQEMRVVMRESQNLAGALGFIERAGQTGAQAGERIKKTTQEVNALSASLTAFAKGLVAPLGTVAGVTQLASSVMKLAESRVQLSMFAESTRLTMRDVVLFTRGMANLGIPSEQARSILAKLTGTIKDINTYQYGSKAYQEIAKMGGGGAEAAEKLRMASGDMRKSIDIVLDLMRDAGPRARAHLESIFGPEEVLLKMREEMNRVKSAQTLTPEEAKEMLRGWNEFYYGFKDWWERFIALGAVRSAATMKKQIDLIKKGQIGEAIQSEFGGPRPPGSTILKGLSPEESPSILEWFRKQRRGSDEDDAQLPKGARPTSFEGGGHESLWDHFAGEIAKEGWSHLLQHGARHAFHISKGAAGLTGGVLSNWFGTGLLDATSTAAAGQDQPSASEIAGYRARGINNLKELAETEEDSNRVLKEIRDMMRGGTGGAGGGAIISGARREGGALQATAGGFRRGIGGGRDAGPSGEPDSGPATFKERWDAMKDAAIGGSDYLRQQRQGMADEINSNPELKKQVAAILSLEHETDPVAVAESLLNRTEFVRSLGQNKSIHDMLFGGFYGPAGMVPGRVQQLMRDPKRMARMMRAIDTALAGSNLLRGATDQGSGNDPNVNWPGGRIKRFGETYNDWGGGPGGHEGARRFRERQQRMVQEAEQRRQAGGGLTDQQLREHAQRRGGITIRDASGQVSPPPDDSREVIDSQARRDKAFEAGTASIEVDFGGMGGTSSNPAEAKRIFKTLKVNRTPQAGKAGGIVTDYQPYAYE